MRVQEIVIEFSGTIDAAGELEVATALLALPGVRDVQVNAGEGRAILTGDAAVVDPDALRGAIVRAGFEAGDVSFPE